MTEQLKPGDWIDEMAEVPPEAWPQPEALRLAELLESDLCDHPIDEAAAELRRLHALCAEWEKKAATWLASPEAAQRLNGYRELAQRLNAAEQVNAQLLEALEDMVRMMDSGEEHGAGSPWHTQASAAIAAAKEMK